MKLQTLFASASIIVSVISATPAQAQDLSTKKYLQSSDLQAVTDGAIEIANFGQVLADDCESYMANATNKKAAKRAAENCLKLGQMYDAKAVEYRNKYITTEKLDTSNPFENSIKELWNVPLNRMKFVIDTYNSVFN